MHCPFCSACETKVIDSRLCADGFQVRRRRHCLECCERFTTFEVMEVVMPRIVKASTKIEPYDAAKLRRSISLPLQKRPISIDEIEAMISRIEKTLRQTGEREISSKQLGEIVMNELKAIDDVAYVRFASVYRDFQDLEAFKAELANIKPKGDSHD
ncbi:transcriptional regulator NrdR [Moraxella nasovis]|uniref:transcriptional regulator NrdR n=1 Tax=Moraxella nasovis TaxID=2904121 RepID=UPI001F60513A|nr:transcriptional regulator NrdR [Moraxella nasovis]UNU72497.1 transcriptional regulator NrdR [Moraxella nasovis]